MWLLHQLGNGRTLLVVSYPTANDIRAKKSFQDRLGRKTGRNAKSTGTLECIALFWTCQVNLGYSGRPWPLGSSSTPCAFNVNSLVEFTLIVWIFKPGYNPKIFERRDGGEGLEEARFPRTPALMGHRFSEKRIPSYHLSLFRGQPRGRLSFGHDAKTHCYDFCRCLLLDSLIGSNAHSYILTLVNSAKLHQVHWARWRTEKSVEL